MTPVLDVATIRDSVLDAALALVGDPIPNIRFNVAKALEVLAVTLAASDPEGQELAGRKIVPALEKLCGDSDPDVRCALPYSISLSVCGRHWLTSLPPFRSLTDFASRALEKTTGVEPMSV
jgi:HEAT repeat protein